MAKKKIKTEKLLSSGGVVYRRRKDGVEVALVSVLTRHGKGPTVWELPKGLVEEGENIARTAHREVREETGLDGRIIEKIGDIHYFYSEKSSRETKRILKIVIFFLMEYTSGTVAFHDAEVEECSWFSASDAARALSFEDEREILVKALAIVAERDMAKAGKDRAKKSK